MKRKLTNVEIAEELLVLLTGDDKIYNSVDEKQKVLKDYCSKCRHNIKGKVIKLSCDELIANIEGKAKWLKQHIQENEWITNKEGYSWYNGYYDNNARRVEGDGECRNSYDAYWSSIFYYE